jgi:hypothetical protein
LLDAGGAMAATGQGPYRTARQAERYLEHHLASWAKVDLRRAKSKAAYCVSASAQRTGDVARNGRARSFSCVLNARVGKDYVFGIHLVATPGGWHATPLR